MGHLRTAAVHYLSWLLLEIEVLCLISIIPSLGINYGGVLLLVTVIVTQL